MDNPFSMESLMSGARTIGIAKGDFDGHPFRGNQYRDGGGGSIQPNRYSAKPITTLSQVALVSRNITQESNKLDKGAAKDLAAAHRAIAETIHPYMKSLIAQSSAAKDSGDKEAAQRVDKAVKEAINAHYRNVFAANHYDDMVSDPKPWYLKTPDTDKAMQLERITSQAADSARTFAAEMERLGMA